MILTACVLLFFGAAGCSDRPPDQAGPPSDAGDGDGGSADTDDAGDGDAGGGDTGGGTGDLPFGALCTDGAECMTGICFLFGDGTRHCSQTCTDSASCPEAMHGRLCNGFGYCAY